MLKVIAVVCLALYAPLAAAQTQPAPPGTPPGTDRLGVDPNYSRLLFAPTGRPLKKGDGYFSDYELVFPGVAVGLTDNLSIAGGVSLIPGVGLDEQVLYVSPKLGWELSDRAAVSIGGLYAAVPADDDVDDIAVAFAVGTFGRRQKSFSVGLGFGDTDLPDGFNPTPILMIGGAVTLSGHVALVSENWLALRDDFDLAEQPFGLGVRFFGDRLSADVGLVLVPEYVGEGGFLPWASISYHFGPSGAAGARRWR
jgi:hypothetical protein